MVIILTMRKTALPKGLISLMLIIMQVMHQSL